MLVAFLLLAGCRATGAPDSQATVLTATTLPAAPFPTATALPAPGAPLVALLSPLLVDEANHRLYAAAQVNGQPRLAVLDARDGRLLAAWETVGPLALDPPRRRLAVDLGSHGLALLDAQTGELTATVPLPPQDAPPAPQIDAHTGLVFAFRQATVHVIDPAISDVIDIVPLSVARTICDAPAGDAPIYRTAYDPAAGRLYLSFLSRQCVPWANITIVAYNARDLTELGRTDLEIRTQFAPLDGRLFGLTVSRLGPSLTWAWDGTAPRQDASSDYQGEPAGVAVDAGRGLVYHAVGERIRLIDRDGVEVGQVDAPLLAGHALAGYYAPGDVLYLVSAAGRLVLWPAGNLFGALAAAVAAPSPLPAAPVASLALSPNWAADGTLVALLEDHACDPPGGRLFVLLDPAVGWQPALGDADRAADTAWACRTVAAVAFSPDYAHDSLLFAATNEPPTVLRSVDGGRSWTAADTPFPPGTTFRALLASPTYAADQMLFALAHSGELYRSRDGGRGWLALDQRLDALAVVDLPGPAVELVGALGSQIVRSGNGDTWAVAGATPNGEPLALLAAVAAGPEPSLYAFTSGGRLARSGDGGASWAVVMETSPGPAQLVFGDGPEATRAVFLLREREVVASYDGLASIWAATSAAEASLYQPTAIAIPPTFTAAPFLYVGTADGQVLRVRADPAP